MRSVLRLLGSGFISAKRYLYTLNSSKQSYYSELR